MACCKICSTGKPCGNSCISRAKSCTERPGLLLPRLITASTLAVFAVVLSVDGATAVSASESMDCAAIPNRSARLQCFTGVPEIIATVGRVVDGDTMDICTRASCVRIRLCGINTPERGEPGGAEATEALRTLASRETVRCVPVGQGTICDGRSRSTNHGRLVAQCFLDGTDIGGVMSERGLACDWERSTGGHYRRTLNAQGCR